MDEVTAEIVILDEALDVGETLAWEITLRNKGAQTVTVAPPLDGSAEGMRDPIWRLELLDADGSVVSAPFGHQELGRCGMTNPLSVSDLRHLPPGGSLTLRGDDLVWFPKQTVLASSRPGTYRARVTYEAGPGSRLTPLSFTSSLAALTLRGGDARLWECRADQIAHRYDPHTHASVYWMGDNGDGYLALIGSYTEGYSDKGEISRGTLSVIQLDPSLQPVGAPLALWEGDGPGFVDAVAVPEGLLVAHTPEAREEKRQIEIFSIDTRGWTSAKRTLGDPGVDYIISLARSGDRVGIAYGRQARSDLLFVSLLDLGGAPLADPRRLTGEGYAGFPTLAPSAEGFLAIWEAGYEQGRALSLSKDLAPLGQVRPFSFGGQTVAAARATSGGFEIVYADGGYRGDDPADGMGLYRLALPGGTPEALSPVDRAETRFGEGDWAEDGRFLWAYLEGDAVRAGVERSELKNLSQSGSEPHVRALSGGRFAVWWPDYRDDSSDACKELDACVSEGWAAVLDSKGGLVTGPSRVTSMSEGKPFAPNQDWERYCR